MIQVVHSQKHSGLAKIPFKTWNVLSSSGRGGGKQICSYGYSPSEFLTSSLLIFSSESTYKDTQIHEKLCT